ncbi:YdcF family protein [Secundilactobacillus yichangensis]|uniref:YdcF family protein n=1 Tax=Secundilactobacillus yichangensis TaxID=2799580 RepID=UPI0019424670|nr:YdcF family protein [Secundilactobacillus yichangensis]
MLTIILIIITLLNLGAVEPLVKHQSNQRLVWGPLLSILVVTDLLIALPVLIWPGHLLATAASVGFATWYLTATGYLWLTCWYQCHTNKAVLADYLIVLGAKVNTDGPSRTLTRRLQTAIDFCSSQPNSPKLILTGGQGSDEPQSEASSMADYLIRHQINPQRLLLEQAATSTKTNFKFSKQLIRQDWVQARQPKILVVTSDYHLVRSKLLAWQQHLPVGLLGSWTTTEALIPAMVREVAALLLQLKWPLLIIWLVITSLIQLFIN